MTVSIISSTYEHHVYICVTDEDQRRSSCKLNWRTDKISEIIPEESEVVCLLQLSVLKVPGPKVLKDSFLCCRWSWLQQTKHSCLFFFFSLKHSSWVVHKERSHIWHFWVAQLFTKLQTSSALSSNMQPSKLLVKSRSIGANVHIVHSKGELKTRQLMAC